MIIIVQNIVKGNFKNECLRQQIGTIYGYHSVPLETNIRNLHRPSQKRLVFVQY